MGSAGDSTDQTSEETNHVDEAHDRPDSGESHDCSLLIQFTDAIVDISGESSIAEAAGQTLAAARDLSAARDEIESPINYNSTRER